MRSDFAKQLLQAAQEIRPGATECPGTLSRRCGTNLAQARATWFDLAQRGQVIITQRGQEIPPEQLEQIKGPFRIAPKRPLLS